MRYPADPPTVDEIVAIMRHTADDRHGWRVRATIVVLWRAGLRIQEALALAEHDLDHPARIDPRPQRQGAAADARCGSISGVGNNSALAERTRKRTARVTAAPRR